RCLFPFLFDTVATKVGSLLTSSRPSPLLKSPCWPIAEAIVGPGEYLPDSTEGITRLEDLPTPLVRRRSRDWRRRRWPLVLPPRARAPRPACPRFSPPRPALRAARHLLPALPRRMPPPLQRRLLRPRPTGRPLHPARHRPGGPPGGRRRVALPCGRLASM